MGNNAVGHFFASWGKVDADFPRLFLAGIGDTIKCITGGGCGYKSSAWRAADIKQEFHNMGHPNNPDYSKWGGYDPNAKTPEDKNAALNYAKTTAANDPSSSFNNLNWGSVSSSARNSTFSKQAGNAGVTPPSNIQAISDPTTKIAISATRGQTRSKLMTLQNMSDVTVAPALQQANSVTK